MVPLRQFSFAFMAQSRFVRRQIGAFCAKGCSFMAQNTLHTGLTDPDSPTAYDPADGSIGRTRSSTAERSVHIGEAAGAAPAGSTIRPILRYLTPSVVAKFDALVDRSAGPDACWPFQGSRKGKSRYGRFCLPRPTHDAFAHRVAWAAHNGKDPGGMLVCHTCDNPPCCNPRHLFLGSVKDNYWDMVVKGRRRLSVQSGESNGNARLNEANVREIWGLIHAGWNNSKIARHYDVGHAMISRIRLGLSWKDLGSQLGPPPAKNRARISRKPFPLSANLCAQDTAQ
jgi:hypothetical protein